MMALYQPNTNTNTSTNTLEDKIILLCIQTMHSQNFIANSDLDTCTQYHNALTPTYTYSNCTHSQRQLFLMCHNMRAEI